VDLSQVKKYKKVIHTFKIGDVEDPNMMAHYIVDEWLNTTTKGKFVNKLKLPLTMTCHFDELGISYNYKLVAYIAERDYTLLSLIGE